ncbi:hypothetical protein BgiBS90_028022, partial [Biomphalaria glabrata]
MPRSFMIKKANKRYCRPWENDNDDVTPAPDDDEDDTTDHQEDDQPPNCPSDDGCSHSGPGHL